jgi:DNA-binding GntR family transcriptional regulator
MVSGPTQIRKIFAEIERNAPEAAALACRAHVEAASAIAKQILGKR